MTSLWGFYCISEYVSFFSKLHISAKICKNSADLHISAKICKNPADLHRFAKIENLGYRFKRPLFDIKIFLHKQKVKLIFLEFLKVVFALRKLESHFRRQTNAIISRGRLFENLSLRINQISLSFLHFEQISVVKFFLVTKSFVFGHKSGQPL